MPLDGETHIIGFKYNVQGIGKKNIHCYFLYSADEAVAPAAAEAAPTPAPAATPAPATATAPATAPATAAPLREI